jgi:protocatechuate 3,4-dioxygenase beta subunit
MLSVVVPSQGETGERKEQQTKALYSTPIAVYGKVVDEAGNPISSATVKIGSSL